ncbi:MAG: hypothetical protein R3F59_29390 [Myxococcota bacterium]
MLIPLLFTDALAANYSAELAIPSTHPGSTGIPASRVVRYSRAVATGVQGNDFTVASSDSRVTCELRNGTVFLHFDSKASTWPSSPFSTTCSYGSDSVNVDVVWMDPAVDPALQDHTIDASDTITFTNITNASAVLPYGLPACASSYVGGLYSSTLPGIRCRVVQNSVTDEDVVQLEIATTATYGTGTCSLPRRGRQLRAAPRPVGARHLVLQHTPVRPRRSRRRRRRRSRRRIPARRFSFRGIPLGRGGPLTLLALVLGCADPPALRARACSGARPRPGTGTGGA